MSTRTPEKDKTLKGDALKQVPHDPRVEQALIGALLLNPEAIVAAEPLLYPTDLFSSAPRAIFSAAVALFQSGNAVNPTTLRHHLEARGEFDDKDGPVREGDFMACMGECADPSQEAAESYAKIIQDYAIRRKMVQAGGQIATAGFEMRAEDAETKANSVLLDATERKGGDAPKPISEIVEQ